MRAISQEHPMGCGVACVASIVGKKYSQVLDVVDKKLASTRGYYCRELVEALAKFGLSYEHRKVIGKTTHLTKKKGAIVFIARSKKYPEGHYLLNTPDGWMDPWINFPDTAESGYRRMLPCRAQWVIHPVD